MSADQSTSTLHFNRTRVGPFAVVLEDGGWHVIDTRDECADSDWFSKSEAIRRAKRLIIREHFRTIGLAGPTEAHVSHVLDALEKAA